MTPVPAPEVAAAARAVLAEVLGAGVPGLGLTTLQTTACSAVLSVRRRPPAPELVLKLVRTGHKPATDLGRTAAVMARAAAAGVPVPRVLAADGSGAADGWQHLLQERVRGSSWHAVHPHLDAAQQHDVHAQLAAVAVALASVRFPGFGDLLTGDATPEPAPLVDVLRRRARLRIAGRSARDRAEALLDRTAGLLATSPGPVLVHDDLHHANLLVTDDGPGWRVVAVLDWDKAWAGPAEADLARLSSWDGMTGPGFWPGYRAAVPVTPGEEERLPVHRLLWCLEHAAPTARHRADTATLCRRFGLRPPDD